MLSDCSHLTCRHLLCDDPASVCFTPHSFSYSHRIPILQLRTPVCHLHGIFVILLVMVIQAIMNGISFSSFNGYWCVNCNRYWCVNFVHIAYFVTTVFTILIPGPYITSYIFMSLSIWSKGKLAVLPITLLPCHFTLWLLCIVLCISLLNCVIMYES